MKLFQGRLYFFANEKSIYHEERVFNISFIICIPGSLYTGNAKSELFMELPDDCPTPDGMVIAPNGDLILACPNLCRFVETSLPDADY